MARKLINDPHAPHCVLYVNDKELPDTTMKLISDITFEDESDMSSSIHFIVTYQRNVVGGVSNVILDNKLFTPGNKVVLKGGYGTDLVVMGAGYIAELEPNFSEDSSPTLKVICYDKLQNMSLLKSETGRSWPATFRDSQVATYVGSESGFVIQKAESASVAGIRGTRKRLGEEPRVQKRGESNYDFLRSLADQNGFELCTKYDPKAKKFRLYFEPHRDQTQPIMSFSYGDDDTSYSVTPRSGTMSGVLRSFNPKFSVTAQFTKYRAYSTNKDGKQIAHTTTLGEFIEEKGDMKLGGVFADSLINLSQTKSGVSVQNSVAGDVVEVVSTKIFTSRKEANEYLKLHMRRLARDYITGSGAIKGNQYIQSRQVITLTGLGVFFNGDYYVKRATHTFNQDGFETTFDVRKRTSEEKTR